MGSLVAGFARACHLLLNECAVEDCAHEGDEARLGVNANLRVLLVCAGAGDPGVGVRDKPGRAPCKRSSVARE